MPGRGARQGPAGRGAPWWSQSCPSSRARGGEGGRGWAESVCPLSMNLCVKEKNQAMKGDAPGKFKLPLDSGEERGLQLPLPHSLPHAPVSPEARAVPSSQESSAPPSTWLEAGGDAPSHHTRPLLGHPGPEGLPVGTWSPRALGLSCLACMEAALPLAWVARTSSLQPLMKLIGCPLSWPVGLPAHPPQEAPPGSPEGLLWPPVCAAPTRKIGRASCRDRV